MEKFIDEQIKIARIQEMKEPTILMNDKDLEFLESKLKSQVNNFKVSENPKYRGIPIETHKHLQMGRIIVYDNFNKPFN